jgi:CubicO group peptidase (beta-lactamase class C family)
MMVILPAVLLVAGCGGHGAPADNRAVDVAGVWERAAPADEGIDPQLLRKVGDRAPEEVPSLESLLVVRHGLIVFERDYAGQAANYHDIQSVTKSIVLLLIGIALHERDVKNLHRNLADFLPRRALARLDPRVGRITVRELLEMRAGFRLDVDSDGTPAFETAANWTQAILARPLTAAPGRRFAYDGGAAHLLSVVLTRATGMPADAFARTRLFRRIGIPDARWSWARDAQGNAEGPTGLRLQARDMARIGYLLLRGGRWNRKAIVPADYVRDATRMHEAARFPAGGPLIGYGYLFWMLPLHGFAAVGFGGQAIAVYPRRDLVVVTKGAIADIAPADLFRLLGEVAAAARRD